MQWWLKSSPSTYLDMINASGIPLYVAANWDEAATKYGAFFTFNNLMNPAKLIVGPTTHCAWAVVESMTGFDISIEEHRFFDYWLKGIENRVMYEDKVYYWTYNEPQGHEWRSAPAWPLPNEKRTVYYLGSKLLDPSAPADALAKDDARVDYSATATSLASAVVYDTAPRFARFVVDPAHHRRLSSHPDESGHSRSRIGFSSRSRSRRANSVRICARSSARSSGAVRSAIDSATFARSAGRCVKS